MKRVEGERGYMHCCGCLCIGKGSVNGVTFHIFYSSDIELIYIIPSLMLYCISPPASYLMLFCSFSSKIIHWLI